MSKISANNGGNGTRVQCIRSHSRFATCLSPSARSSAIFASRAGIIWRALPATSGRVRTIWTRSASATLSLQRNRCLWLNVSMRLLRSVSRTRAANRPVSTSLKPNELRPLAKLQNAVEKLVCRYRKDSTIQLKCKIA